MKPSFRINEIYIEEDRNDKLSFATFARVNAIIVYLDEQAEKEVQAREQLKKGLVPMEEPKKRWMPQIDEKFWSIHVTGKVQQWLNLGGDFEKDCIEYGNCFLTREKAESAAAKIKELLINLQSE